MLTGDHPNVAGHRFPSANRIGSPKNTSVANAVTVRPPDASATVAPGDVASPAPPTCPSSSSIDSCKRGYNVSRSARRWLAWGASGSTSSACWPAWLHRELPRRRPVTECYGLQRVLHPRPHLYPLMPVPHKRAQISLLGRGHPDRWKVVLCEQLQEQVRVPPIVLLLAWLGRTDHRWMTHSAFNLQLLHELQKPLHRSGGFDPYQDRTWQRGIDSAPSRLRARCVFREDVRFLVEIGRLSEVRQIALPIILPLS